MLEARQQNGATNALEPAPASTESQDDAVAVKGPEDKKNE